MLRFLGLLVLLLLGLRLGLLHGSPGALLRQIFFKPGELSSLCLGVVAVVVGAGARPAGASGIPGA